MSKPKNHIPRLYTRVQAYADARSLDFHLYTPYHMRITDGGYVTLDMWTTGRYYVLMTDYLAMVGGGIERGGEKGSVPIKELEPWLDMLFFPEGIRNDL